MPTWQPDWTDVRFDHAAAESAAAACRAAAGGADDVITGLATASAEVVDEWSGTYRDQFDGEHPAVAGDLRTVRDELLALAASIEGAAEAATTEQARREADRERWRAELLAERARGEPRPADRPDGGPV